MSEVRSIRTEDAELAPIASPEGRRLVAVPDMMPKAGREVGRMMDTLERIGVRALSVRHCVRCSGPVLEALFTHPHVGALEWLDLGASDIRDADLRGAAAASSLQVLYLDDTAVTDAVTEHLQALGTLRTLRLDATSVGGPGLQRLSGLSLRELGLAHTNVDDAAIDAILHHTALQGLDLSATDLTDVGGARLGALGELRRLTLSHTRVGDRTAAALAGSRQLAVLRVNGTAVSDEGLEVLPMLPRLQVLDLSETSVTDAGFVHVTNLVHLRELRVGGTRISTLAPVQGATVLSHLDASDTSIDDTALAMLGPHTEMEVLRLARTAVTDAGLRSVGHMTKLRRLDLADTGSGDGTVEVVLRFPELRALVLSRTRVPPSAIAELGALEHLVEIGLAELPVRDEEVGWLRGRPLTVLDLGRTFVSPALVQDLLPSRTLEVLDLTGISVGASHLRGLSRTSRLDSLILAETDVGDGMGPLLRSHPRISTLDLSRTRVTDAVFEGVCQVRGLQELWLAETDVTGDGLGACTGLSLLGLRGTAVAESLEEISSLQGLTWLDLDETPTGDQDVAALATAGRLRTLRLGATAITDRSIAVVAQLPELRALALDDTGVTDEGVSALRSLEQLLWLDLSRTRISARIIPSVCATPVTELHLRGEMVDRTFVKPLLACSRVRHLDLRGSRLTGRDLRRLGRRTDWVITSGPS